MIGYAAHTVYRRLRGLLLHGSISPGTRLVESDWATKLGANRAAIREAAMVLTHEGLLERGKKGGYFVPQYDAERLSQLQSVREIIELGALRDLEVKPPSKEALDKLESVCVQMEWLMESQYFMGFVEADHRFHLQLVELSGNPHLLRLYLSAPLPLALAPAPDIDPAILQEQQLETLNGHRDILKYLVAGDYAAARDSLVSQLPRRQSQSSQPQTHEADTDATDAAGTD